MLVERKHFGYGMREQSRGYLRSSGQCLLWSCKYVLAAS